MPILDGVEATRLLAGPDVTDPIVVVVITTFDTDQNIYGALRAGARGFLLKGAAPEQLVQAIEAAHRGDALIDPGVTARVLASLAATNTGEPAQPIEPLTPREESVLLEVARGRTNAEIAADLYISMSTVKFHLVSLMTKMDARNRVEGHVGLRDRPTQIAEETLIPTLSRGDQVTADQQHLETAGPGGDTRGDDCAIQCDRPDAGHRLFGQATHRTRRRTHGLQPC
jgi:DNA-binding NarL/FixJ family response regulator